MSPHARTKIPRSGGKKRKAKFDCKGNADPVWLEKVPKGTGAANKDNRKLDTDIYYDTNGYYKVPILYKIKTHARGDTCGLRLGGFFRRHNDEQLGFLRAIAIRGGDRDVIWDCSNSDAGDMFMIKKVGAKVPEFYW